MPTLKLYGVPLSQPFRSVAWLLLLKRTPFEIVVTVPGVAADKPYGSRHEDYRSKTKCRSVRIPMLQDDNDNNNALYLVESAAILSYLCESRGWDDLYGPPGSRRKAKIDSYLHWHHTGTRRLANLVAPIMMVGAGLELRDKDKRAAQKVLEELETGWLHNRSTTTATTNNDSNEAYIAGDNLSIADLLCYEDIAQVSKTNMVDLRAFPSVLAWTQRMEAQPFYEQVHSSILALGNLSVHSDKPMRQRLKEATGIGLQTLTSTISKL